MTPAKLAASGTESGHQRALFATVAADLWLLRCQSTPEHYDKWDGIDRTALAPLRWLHSIPNGGSRGDTAQSRGIRGAVLKAEGLKPGIPDVFLPYPRVVQGTHYCGLYIEMKKPKGKASDEQLEFKDYATSVGYAWALCDTWEKAYATIIDYLTRN